MSGFKVPGSLTVTKQSLDSVEDHKLVQDVLAQEFTAVRAAATESQAFTYFIQCVYDINAQISHQASGTGGEDDAWGMAEINLDSASRCRHQEASFCLWNLVPAGLILPGYR